jgi:hypothetical protein
MWRPSFRHSDLAHAFENDRELGRVRWVVDHSRPEGAVRMYPRRRAGNCTQEHTLAEVARRSGAAPSAIEVFAHDTIEVKNVVRAKGATWSLKAWFDLSSDDSAGGEGGGGGQRIAFRRPDP